MSEVDDFSNGYDEFSELAHDFGDSNSEAIGEAVKCFLLRIVADGAEIAMKSRKCRKRHISLLFSRENLENACAGSRTRPTEEENCSFYRETKRVPERASNSAISGPKFQNPIPNRLNSDSTLNLTAFLVMIALKLITFQLNLAVSFFVFPIWVSYVFFSFILFPFHAMSQIKIYITKQLQEAVENLIIRIQRAVRRLGRALFWAGFVGSVLVMMLILGFVVGGVMVKFVVEKPMMMKESLHFDYRMSKPVAVVPLSSSCNPRSLVYNQMVRAEVLLTVPESEYNRKLGIFQVRIEFLSANGRASSSASYPCMLRFKSKPVRLMETVIRTGPLLAGFQLEAQTLEIKTNEFKEAIEPTKYVKVRLEERAGHSSDGHGIPEIYSAIIVIESTPPRLRKMLWLWRWTVFVWISFALFAMELVVGFIFLRVAVTRRGRSKEKKVVLLSSNWGS